MRGLSAYYQNDVEQMAANWDRLDPNRALAKAIVRYHVGELYARREIDHGSLDEPPRLDSDEDDDDESWSFASSTWRERALECLQQSLGFVPDLLPALVVQATVRARWYGASQAVGDFQTLLGFHPENVLSLAFLGRYYSESDQPFVAMDYVQRLRRLKPLDAKVASLA